MRSSSENTKVTETENVIAAEIISFESINKAELLRALAPSKSKALPKMVEKIFTLPLKEPGTSTTLKELIRLSKKADKEDYNYPYDLDLMIDFDLEPFYWTMCRILDKGQGLSLHVIAKLELLSSMLGHVLEDSIMAEFRATASKWLDVIKDNQ